MLIQELTLKGVLSFGPDSPPLPMRPLNVLIGPNGSGKSNFVEAIDLLRSSPNKLTSPMRGPGGGGVMEWIWKGEPPQNAIVEAVVKNPNTRHSLRHRIEFTSSSAQFELVDETIESSEPDFGETDVFFFYRYQNGHPVISVKDDMDKRRLQRQDIETDESILSQRKDPDQYPELAYLSKVYSKFRLYREWSFGRSSVFRSPQSADLPSDQLEENFSNLGLFLNYIRGFPASKKMILDYLSNLYEGLSDFDIRIRGGSVEVFLTEQDFIIPASRLSDGTLRFLCLLAILCDPEPPNLICIEEPELGLHPDMIPQIADLLVKASKKTQVVVTTHSDILVDAMTETPESVVVVEKHHGQTVSKRIEVDNELKEFLKTFRLGQLWLRGDIGGTRF